MVGHRLQSKMRMGHREDELRIKPKDKEQREIPLPASPVEALRDYKERQTGFSRNDLDIPALQRRPDKKLENKNSRMTAVRL